MILKSFTAFMGAMSVMALCLLFNVDRFVSGYLCASAYLIALDLLGAPAFWWWRK